MSGSPLRSLSKASTRVAVVVPLFNGAGILDSCLRALLADSAANVRVVVVDDGSRDAGAAQARSIAAQSGGRIDVLAMDRNRGFAAAVNCGCAWSIAQTPAPEVLVLVNQDCVVRPGWLIALLDELGDPTVCATGARLLEADGITLQHAGGCVESNGLTRHLGRGSRDQDAWRETLEVEYACAALFAVRTEVWTRMGGFDEGYAPAYFEEVDWCARARAAGGRIVSAGKAEAVHLEAASSGGHSRLFLERYHRSRMRYIVRRMWPSLGVWRWLGAEVRWLMTLRRWEEIAPVLLGYLRVPSLVAERVRERDRPRAHSGAPGRQAATSCAIPSDSVADGAGL